MESLLKKLISRGYLKSESVYKAMLQVDRGDFTSPAWAYDDW
jgi:hypothetical protein